VIQRALDAGVKSIINVRCWDKEKGFVGALDIPGKYPFVSLALGVHPHEADFVKDSKPIDFIREAAKEKKIVAIGETGLDYHYNHSAKKAQRDIFIKHIKTAREVGLPLIIHSREADDDTIAILKDEGAEETGGVMHCFSGDAKIAEELLELGFYLSFTGVITFPKAEAVREVLKIVPIERLMVETDCPYLAPVPYRGKRCEPAFVVETAKKMAEVKGLSLEDVARITTLNAETLFGLVGEKEEEARIAYAIRNSLYLNITNRCTNYCTFCAKFDSYTVKGHYLRLKKEPSVSEVLRAIGPEPEKYEEIVFCGFGEPLIRLDLVKEVGLSLKKRGCRIRVDTDGLANLVHGRNVLPELKFVDCVSVSLNAQDSETYQKLVKTPFKDKAYPAILWFLREAKKHITKVVASVVAVPGLDIEACRRVAEIDIGVKFRVREYDTVG
ncbi:MAG: TatD family hydrolase, partial [Thermodesulfobacteriota bacterium]